MSDRAVRVVGLSKRYRIGLREPYSTIREALMHAASAPLRAVRSWGSASGKGTGAEWIWALRNIDLEVKPGEVVGIIGRNGAGKSTLLKVLSGITEPTTGYADIYGRVGSLLEVGTGFHMELTGRENVFMNGALLGMRRHEIRRKFDEIVAFAEVEQFIDTPVKRYSSGMYMRLAFAVAAHLDPEILIVDEVLAVGDVQFQRKCLGKMREVAKSQGRTVLFVSHNMDAIQRLCSRCYLLEAGRLVADGDPASVVGQYLQYAARIPPQGWIELSQAHRTGTGEARFVAVQYSSLNEAVAFQPYSDGPVEFLLALESDSPRSTGSLAVSLHDLSGTRLVNADTLLIGRTIHLGAGRNLLRLTIEKLHLNPGVYRVALWLANPRSSRSARDVYDYIESAFEIEVVHGQSGRPDFSPNSAVTCEFDVRAAIGETVTKLDSTTVQDSAEVLKGDAS